MEIFEYSIRNSEVVEIKWEVIEEMEHLLRIKHNKNARFIKIEDIGKIKSNRICFQEPNFETAKILLIEKFEADLNRDIEKIRKRSTTLYALKNENQ